MLPYAKGLSVKTHYKADGSHTSFDLDKMLNLCVSAHYNGYWGIESEGKEADEYQAIKWTKAAIEHAVFSQG